MAGRRTAEGQPEDGPEDGPRTAGGWPGDGRRTAQRTAGGRPEDAQSSNPMQVFEFFGSRRTVRRQNRFLIIFLMLENFGKVDFQI